MISKSTLESIAYNLGVSALGVTSAKPLFDVADIIKNNKESSIIFKNEDEINSRCNPLSLLPSAKSIITAFQPYAVKEVEAVPPLYGLIAPFARSNYYKELRKKLEKLAKHLKKDYGGDFYISVNGSKLCEKPIAVKSGLGFYGKNSIVINKKFGSYGVLGCLLTSLEIETDSPIGGKCAKCDICKKACPSGAIDGNGFISISKCLQYICQQQNIKDEYIKLLGQTLYGCNICQDICPLNKKAEIRKDLPDSRYLGEMLYLPELIYLSDSEWRDKFKGYQLGAKWLEPAAIIKNALISISNSKSSDAKKILVEFLSKGRSELKELTVKLLQRL